MKSHDQLEMKFPDLSNKCMWKHCLVIGDVARREGCIIKSDAISLRQVQWS